MLKLHYLQTALVAEKKVEKLAKQLEKYIENLQEVVKQDDYQALEASLQLPKDVRQKEAVKALAKKVGGKNLKYVVVVGIGGSNLGAMAVYDAIYGPLDHLKKGQHPKLLFLDTVSEINLLAVKTVLSGLKEVEEFLIVVISKSGKTVETIANLEALTMQLSEQFSEVQKRTVVVTDEGSDLWQQAEEFALYKIQLPQMVGGRFSVFSSVGLLPLVLSGINIDLLMDGAEQAIDDCTSLSLKKNFALLSAILSYYHRKKGLAIHNSFYFNSELESCGKWYRQLMGESIGKEKDLNKKVVRQGITPIVSIGSTDLHSMAQLYFGGPKDKFTNIIYSLNEQGVFLPQPLNFDGLVDKIEGKTFSQIMKAIIGGVQAAYRKNNLPYLNIELPDINEQTIGYYLQFRMIEMMYLAQLLKVNAFDQPNVEDYKVETRKLLGK